MILSILVILLIAGISYFHYAQGMFTSTISAFAAVIAACMAVSYHENLAAYAFTGHLVDQGNGVSLIMIFVVIYFALRLIFDKLIPGNVRLPLYVTTVGGAVMGLIAGIFATGILAIAAQTMPFGPSVLGATRFKTLADRPVQIPTGGQSLDEVVSNEIRADTLDPADRQTLIIPVDDWVLSFVSHISDSGPLDNDHPMSAIHPAYLDEMFGQRTGIQQGASIVAFNTATKNPVRVQSAFLLPAVAEANGEIPAIRKEFKVITPVLKADPDNAIVVIHVVFNDAAADDDHMVRFTPGAVRLVANGINYNPLGTLDGNGILLMNKPDDELIVAVDAGERGADLVFHVPTKDVLKGAGPKTPGTFMPGVFLEVKRSARMDLDGVALSAPEMPDGSLNVLRKVRLVTPPAPKGLSWAVTDFGELSPLLFTKVDLSSKLPHTIAAGGLEGDPATVNNGTVTGEVRSKKFSKLHIAMDSVIANLGNGDNPTDDVFAPAGKQIVQIVGTIPPKTKDPWLFAEHVGDFSILDAKNTAKSYMPVGVWAKVMKDSQPMLVASYDVDAGVTAMDKAPDARPTDVWLIFAIPKGASLRELDYQGKLLAPLNTDVK